MYFICWNNLNKLWAFGNLQLSTATELLTTNYRKIKYFWAVFHSSYKIELLKALCIAKRISTIACISIFGGFLRTKAGISGIYRFHLRKNSSGKVQNFLIKVIIITDFKILQNFNWNIKIKTINSIQDNPKALLTSNT